jgi:ribosomal protein S18 acetylase RimI-like enzyme
MSMARARVEISEESSAILPEYARIATVFEVARVLDVSPIPGRDAATDAPGERFVLTERRLPRPYVKNYDAVTGDAPTAWAKRFDLSRWRFFLARAAGRAVGAAAVAFDTPGVEMLDGRRDLAVLWDIRVAPESRGQGVGVSLFRAASAWAISKGCRSLKIETQNNNVAACRFYERMGCRLMAANPGVYLDLPHETQMLWYKELASTEGVLRE